MALNLKPFDVFYGGELAPWSKPWIRIPQYIIMLVTGGKTHVMLALYPDARKGYEGNWIVAECTFPEGVRWKSISKVPKSYTVRRNPYGWNISNQQAFDSFIDENGLPYDWPELLEFLNGKKVVHGLSNKWWVCSTWIQHMYDKLGHVLFGGDSATPKMYEDWPKVDV